MIRHIPYRPLGAFRLFLALLVVLQHYLEWCFPGRLQGIVNPYEPGSTAVLVFFVLSGFVIFEAADRIYIGRPVAYSINRALRIGPLYVLSVVLCFGALYLAGVHTGAISLPNFAENVLLIVPLPGRFALAPDFTVIRIAWALRIEVAFYAVVAILLVLGSFWDFRRAAAVVGVALLAASVIWRDTPYLHFAPYFVCGAAFYVCLSGSRTAGILCAVAAALSIAATDEKLVPLYVILLCAAGALGAISIKHSRIDRALGELSYPVYLGHWVPLLPFDGAAPPDRPLLVLAAGIAIPVLLWLLIEPGIRRLRTAVRGVRIGQDL